MLKPLDKKTLMRAYSNLVNEPPETYYEPEKIARLLKTLEQKNKMIEELQKQVQEYEMLYYYALQNKNA